MIQICNHVLRISHNKSHNYKAVRIRPSVTANFGFFQYFSCSVFFFHFHFIHTSTFMFLCMYVCEHESLYLQFDFNFHSFFFINFFLFKSGILWLLAVCSSSLSDWYVKSNNNNKQQERILKGYQKWAKEENRKILFCLI